MNNRGFASDNNSGVHPKVFEAMIAANNNHTIAYGDDDYTKKAQQLFKKHFGENTQSYFVFNGTGANVLGLSTFIESYNSIICSDTAHINVDECGAPEKFTGSKVLTLENINGKLTVNLIKKHMHGIDFEHHSQPKIISITQATELGTVYTPDEIKQITEYAHQNNLLVHLDGARICNAAAFLNCSLDAFTSKAGIDVLSFGGTKNGLMYGEALLFFNHDVYEKFKYIRKQGMQLASKMRYISAQFIAMLEGDLWLQNAKHSNQMAQLLYQEIKDVKGLEITQKVEANGIFAKIPKQAIFELQKEFFFYTWDEHNNEVRWMCSYDTTKEDVLSFADNIRKIVNKYA